MVRCTLYIFEKQLTEIQLSLNDKKDVGRWAEGSIKLYTFIQVEDVEQRNYFEFET